jgi:hypothetical protein
MAGGYQIIIAPNGDYVQFPADTPDDVINAAMRKEYGGPKPSALSSFNALPSVTTPQGDQVVRPSTASDVGQSFMAGLRESPAAMAGLPGNLEALGRAGLNWATRNTIGHDVVSPETLLPTSGQMISEAQDTTAGNVLRQRARQLGYPAPEPQTFYQPQTRAGKYAEAVGMAAPSAAFPVNAATIPGQIATRALVNTAVPAVASEAAGQATEGTAAEPYARVIGALLGTAGPRVAGRLVTPVPARSPELLNAAEYLERPVAEGGPGVTLTAGQRTGSIPLQYSESQAQATPGAGHRMTNLLDQQKREFTTAAMSRVGETPLPGERFVLATDDVLRNARDRIGGEFQRIGNTNAIDFSVPFMAPTPSGGFYPSTYGAELRRNLLRLQTDYEMAVPAGAQRDFAADLVRDIGRNITAGRMTGTSAQAWYSRLSRMSANTADPEYARFLGGAAHALSDTFSAMMSPQDATAWQMARRQYQHLLTVERAVGGAANENTGLGILTPARLGAAAREGNREAFAEGRAPYSDLVTAGATTMSPLPNSGTPGRLVANAVPAMVAGGVAHLAGFGPEGITGAGLAGAAVPPAYFRAISSRRGQAYLGNQVMSRPRPTLGGNSIAGEIAPNRSAAIVNALRGYETPAKRRARAVENALMGVQ